MQKCSNIDLFDKGTEYLNGLGQEPYKQKNPAIHGTAGL